MTYSLKSEKKLLKEAKKVYLFWQENYNRYYTHNARINMLRQYLRVREARKAQVTK